jgi:hypothetical protein
MGKCRFWLSYTNQRGTLHQGTPSPGDSVHVRGQYAGVQVTPRPRDRDEFDVSMTTGSHETGLDVHLGTVKDTPDGPVWEPAVKTGTDTTAWVSYYAAGPDEQHVTMNVFDPDTSRYIPVRIARTELATMAGTPHLSHKEQ